MTPKTGVTEALVTKNDHGKRLDKVVRKAFKDLPLSSVFKAIRQGKIKLNQQKVGPQTPVKTGDIISFYGQTGYTPPLTTTIKPAQNSHTLTVIFESDDLIVVLKPQGMKTHDGARSATSYLLSQIEYEPSLSFTPGPVHRLDRNTSGLLCFAKTLKGAQNFQNHQQAGSIEKKYFALFEGQIKTPLSWIDKLSYHNGKSYQDDIAGLVSKTSVYPIKFQNNQTLAKVILHSGRTHQIRSQAAIHGHPLVNDAKYSGRQTAAYYYLHAFALTDLSPTPLFPPLENYPNFFYIFTKED